MRQDTIVLTEYNESVALPISTLPLDSSPAALYRLDSIRDWAQLQPEDKRRSSARLDSTALEEFGEPVRMGLTLPPV